MGPYNRHLKSLNDVPPIPFSKENINKALIENKVRSLLKLIHKYAGFVVALNEPEAESAKFVLATKNDLEFGKTILVKLQSNPHSWIRIGIIKSPWGDLSVFHATPTGSEEQRGLTTDEESLESVFKSEKSMWRTIIDLVKAMFG